MTKSWSFTWVGTPGTSCTTTGTTTYTPTVNCNDDAVVTATLSASDGLHPAVTSVATVNIGNAGPVITSVTVPTAPVPLGSSVALTGNFTDAGSHDTHGASIFWGDTTSSSGTVNESGHLITGAHVYTAPGSYPVTVVLTDDDGGIDSWTTTTDVVVVGPPTASAGGPYVYDEGDSKQLTGSASGSLPLTTNWSFVPGVSDPGTSCSFAGTTGLTPTVGCNDDVVVAGSLTVSDGVNPPVVSNTTVNFANVAPTLAPLTVTAAPIAVGQTVTVSGNFTDVGLNDTHTATVDWGVGSPASVPVSEVPGNGSVTDTHAYVAAGTYPVTVTVSDKDGGVASRTIWVTVDAPPSVDSGGPYAGNEGTTLTLGGSATDPDGDPLTRSWTFSVAGGPGTSCTTTGTTTYAPTITCNDNAIVTATLTVSDGINTPVSDVTIVSVGNVSPTAGTLSVAPGIQATGSAVSATLSFADAGTNDTHVASVDWGDTPSSSATVSESSGAGTASGTHTYSNAGIYTVTMTVTDDDGGIVTRTASVVIYDLTGPWVTANGNFSSPAGAYTPENPSDPDITGTGHIDFLARYQHGDTVPTGHGEFRFQAAGLELEATGFSWLVVTNGDTEAFFRGVGEVNGASGYEFLVAVVDGSPDLARIKVWQTSSGTVVYDNEAGAPDTADPVTPMTGSGIVIH